METTSPLTLEALAAQLQAMAAKLEGLEAEILELHRVRSVSEARPAYAPVGQVAELDAAAIKPKGKSPPAGREARGEKLTLPPNVPPASAEMEPFLAQLYAEGVLVPPPPEMLEIAARWDAVPEDEKRALDEELRSLKLDPPLSEMIHLMRGGWYPEISEQAQTEGG